MLPTAWQMRRYYLLLGMYTEITRVVAESSRRRQRCATDEEMVREQLQCLSDVIRLVGCIQDDVLMAQLGPAIGGPRQDDACTATSRTHLHLVRDD